MGLKLSILIMVAFGLVRYGLGGLWETGERWWEKRRKPRDPAAEQRRKAWKALLALAAGIGTLAWLMYAGMAMALKAAGMANPQVVIIGSALALAGLMILRLQARMPKEQRRYKMGLLLLVVGLAVAAYGLGYIG
jgi:hypothetical protein